MLARYYEAGLARFLSVDLSRASVNSRAPQSWKRYQYVRNNPLLNVDRNGQIEASFLGEFRNQGAWAKVPPTPDSAKAYAKQLAIQGANALGGVSKVATAVSVASALLAVAAPATAPWTVPIAQHAATAAVSADVGKLALDRSPSNIVDVGVDVAGGGAAKVMGGFLDAGSKASHRTLAAC